MSRGVVGGTGLTFGDIARTMLAIEEHHQVKMSMTCKPQPASGGGLVWTLLATASVRLGSMEDPWDPQSWAYEYSEYTPDLGRTASSLYRALLMLDWRLTRERWAQLPLPEG